MRRLVLAAGVSVGLATCAPPGPPQAPAPSASARGEEGLDLSRAGTLRQDEFSLQLSAADLRIEVTFLADWILEAAAPDTQSRLRRLAESHGRGFQADLGAEEGLTLALVTVSSFAPNTDFEPQDLHLVVRGLRQRPVGIRAITPDWGTGRVGQQTSSMAVYAYPPALDLTRDVLVEYGPYSDGSWSMKVPMIEAERRRSGGA